MPAELSAVLPPVILKAIRSGLKVMDKKWRGQFLKNAVLVGPEMRGSSPVRIDRDRESYQTPGIVRLYPAGEGAGYAGGIISAAVDGLRCSKAIVGRIAEIERQLLRHVIQECRTCGFLQAAPAPIAGAIAATPVIRLPDVVDHWTLVGEFCIMNR